MAKVLIGICGELILLHIGYLIKFQVDFIAHDQPDFFGLVLGLYKDSG